MIPLSAQDRADLHRYRDLYKDTRAPWLKKAIIFFENGKQRPLTQAQREVNERLRQLVDQGYCIAEVWRIVNTPGVSYSTMSKLCSMPYTVSDETAVLALEGINRSFRTFDELRQQKIVRAKKRHRKKKRSRFAPVSIWKTDHYSKRGYG